MARSERESPSKPRITVYTEAASVPAGGSVAGPAPEGDDFDDVDDFLASVGDNTMDGFARLAADSPKKVLNEGKNACLF
jgi:hypothetical protein